MFTEIYGLLKDIYPQYIFWKDMQYQRVVIISHSYTHSIDRNEMINQYFEIEGTIDKVMLFPAGFKLINVKERYKVSNYSMLYIDGQPEPVTAAMGRKEIVVREVNEKIVSFSSIEQLEFKDCHDEAIEPVM